MAAKRMSKRQAREEEELAALQKQAGRLSTPGEDKIEEADGEAGNVKDASPSSNCKTVQAQPVSAFAALSLNSDEEEREQDEGNEQERETESAPAKGSSKTKKKKQKKNRSKGLQTEDALQTGEASGSTTPSTDKGTLGLSKGGSKYTNARALTKGEKRNVEDMSMDEFDRLLAQERATSDATSGAVASTGSGAPASSSTEYCLLNKLRSTLSCTAQNFDPFVELKRTFGAAAVKAYESEARSTGGSGAAGGRAARMRNAAHNPNMRLRCVLVQPKPEWLPIAQTFTGMNMEDHVEEGKGKICSWIHSRAYKEAQYNFLEAVRSYDPNSLHTLIRIYPWHIDTLLQLSEVLRHQGDLGQAGDFVSRALFAYERCANPSFVSSLTSSSGPAQVDFSRIENRGFYLAAHRHINYLGRRGTWRTSLEWCKLLLSIAAPSDPHAVLLWVDFLAIKSSSHKWVLQLDEALTQARGSVEWAVGWQFAKALAYRGIEREERNHDHAKSNTALEEAMGLHPIAAPVLLKKLGTEIPMEALDDPSLQVASSYSEINGRDAYVHLLSHLYAARSESLWKDHDHQSWLSETFRRVWPVIKKKARRPNPPDGETLTSIYRHVIVSDIPDTLRQQLISLMPPDVTSRSELLEASDPFPPAYGTRFDDEYFADISGRMPSSNRGGPGGRRGAQDLMRMIQDAQDRLPQEEQAGFFNDLIQQMHPGGWNGDEDGEANGGREAQGGVEGQQHDARGILERLMAFLQARRPE